MFLAIHIIADKPIAAMQGADGDGGGGTSFYPTKMLANRFAFPIDAQYISAACPKTTTITLYVAGREPEIRSCVASANKPGKAYFGNQNSGIYIPARSYLEASSNIYVIYENSQFDDEHNVIGSIAIPRLITPILDAAPATVALSSINITGIAESNTDIALYKNGDRIATIMSLSDGSFSSSVTLNEGSNAIYAIAFTDQVESYPSAVANINYTPALNPQPALALQSQTLVPSPVLNTVASPTNDNPYTISGTASSGSTVRIYVNETLQTTVIANASGLFSATTILNDGVNSIYATEWTESSESTPSNNVSINYINNLSRNLSGTIIQDTVWTNGDGAAYHIDGNLTVAESVKLIIQPGVRVEFSGYHKLTIAGSLKVRGSASQAVTFTSGQASPARGNWQGIKISSTANDVEIEYALIEYANIGLEIDGTSDVKVTHNEIRHNDTGVQIKGSPQEFTANYIHDNYYGIYISGAGSSPLISGANKITANSYGIYIYGNGVAADNPLPVVTGNSIYGNSNSDYYASNYGDASNVTLDASGNWWGTVDGNQIIRKIHDHLDNNDSPWVSPAGYLDSEGGDASEALSIYRLILTNSHFNSIQDEEVGLEFATNTAVTSTLEVYASEGATLLYSETQNHLTGGIYTYSWNGRNQTGDYLPDGEYKLVLKATDGSNQFVWDPPPPSGEGSGSGQIPASYNIFQNEFWKMYYSMPQTGRVSMYVTPAGGTAFSPINSVAYGGGEEQLLVWDGRDPNGNIVTGASNIYFPPPVPLKENTVVLYGSKPAITGTGLAPNIEVKSDPYYITHSYDQITKITYRIDQDSTVTFKLLPPGVSDPASSQAITLLDSQVQSALNSQGQPLNHVVEWSGYASNDTNNIQISAEGVYTFSIEATSSRSGQNSLYRGVVQIRK